MPVASLWINALEMVLMRAETDHVMLVAVHLLNIDDGIDRTWEHSHDESQLYICVIRITIMKPVRIYLLLRINILVTWKRAEVLRNCMLINNLLLLLLTYVVLSSILGLSKQSDSSTIEVYGSKCTTCNIIGWSESATYYKYLYALSKNPVFLCLM